MILIGTLDPECTIPFPRSRRQRISARQAIQWLDPAGQGNNQGVCAATITMAQNPVMRASPYAGMLFNGLGRPIDLNRPCQTLPASMGGNKTPFIDTSLLANPNAPDWLAATHQALMNGANPNNFVVPPQFRRITVSEAAALQGFPADFQFCGSQCDKYKQIGNSVPPPFAYCIARSVMTRMRPTRARH